MAYFTHPQGMELSEVSSLHVREVMARLILPDVIDGSLVARYVRKAVRLGVWRSLRAESRALLRALTLWGGVIRSKVLARIVKEILLEIELHTLRGRALLYGLYIALRSGLNHLLSSLEKVLCLGISYLSNSPAFKFLG